MLGAALDFVCAPDGKVRAFNGTGAKVEYFFFASESETRAAYDGVLRMFGLHYNADGGCPNVKGAEETWHHTDTPHKPEGRLLCGMAKGPQSQYYQTIYGQPVVYVIYRDGRNMKILDTIWLDATLDTNAQH